MAMTGASSETIPMLLLNDTPFLMTSASPLTDLVPTDPPSASQAHIASPYLMNIVQIRAVWILEIRWIQLFGQRSYKAVDTT